MSDYATMRQLAALSPAEQAASDARETSASTRAELEQAILAERDPAKREVLRQLHERDFGDAGPGAAGAPAPRQRLSLGDFLAGQGSGNAPGVAAGEKLPLVDFLNSIQVPEAPPPPSGALRRVLGDTAVSIGQGIIGVPEAAVGLADIATGGRVGKVLENEGGAIGFRPKEAREYLGEFLSPEQKAANQAVNDAQGVTDTASAIATHPSVIVQSIAQSLPSMLGGGVTARALMAGATHAVPALSGYMAAARAAPFVASPAARTAASVAPVVAGALGEGVVSAGQTGEQVRQDTPGGLTTERQGVIAAGSGALTSMLGVLGGALARRMGIADIDTLMAGKATPEVTRSFTKRFLGGVVSEGLLEELPQSLQEQVAQNMATGRPLDEGVAQATILGALAGGAMGGGAQVMEGGHHVRTPGDEERQTKLPEIGPATRAVNAGVETQAKIIDVAHGVITNPPPGAPMEPAVAPPVVDPADASTTPGAVIEQSPPIGKVDPDAALARMERNAKREANAMKFGAPAEPAKDRQGPAGTADLDAPVDPGIPTIVRGNDGQPFKSQKMAERHAARIPGATVEPADAGGFVVHIPLTAKAAAAETVIDQNAHGSAESPKNDLTPPTQGQADAGNYQLGHDAETFPGIDLSLENPEGSTRKDKHNVPPKWETLMRHHYGYIKGTVGADSNPKKRQGVDVFVKPGTPKGHTGPVFVVDQRHGNGRFDEHKAMLGFADQAEAQAAYLSNYEKGWTGMKAITPMSFDEFKAWVRDPSKTKLPAAQAAQGAETPASAAAQGSAADEPAQAVSAPDTGAAVPRESSQEKDHGKQTLPRTEGAEQGAGQAAADEARADGGQAAAQDDGQGGTREEVLTTRRPMRPHAAVAGSSALGAISNRLGGISPKLLPDLSEKVQRTQTSKSGKTATYTAWKNPPHAGRGPLFRKGGSEDLSELARVLTEAGYIEPGAANAEARAQEIIKAELAQPGSTVRLGDAQAVEAEGRKRLEAANDVATPLEGLSDHDLDELGYADASDIVKQMTEQLIAQAEAAGLDTEVLRDDAVKQTEGETQAAYHARLQEIVGDAIRAARQDAGQRDTARPTPSGGAGVEDAGAQGTATGDQADGPDGSVRAAEEVAAYGATPPTEPFYSELARQTASAPMRAGTAQAWADYIKGLVAKGAVKADEVEWSGLNEWLAMQPGKVTNADVQTFLKANGVQVSETVLGNSLVKAQTEYERQIDELVQEYRLWNAEQGLNLGSADDHLGDPALTEAQREWLRDYSERWDSVDTDLDFDGAEDEPDATRYGRYTLPGGENYRELLLTLPRMPGKQGVLRKAVFDKYNPEIQALADRQDAAVRSGARDTALIRQLGDEQQALRIQRDAEARAAAGEMPEYQSNHWDQQNILAHVRFNERTDADGKRVLFIEEIQSDWAQQGKKRGFRGVDPQAEIDALHAKHNATILSDIPEPDRARVRELQTERDKVPAAPFVGKTDAWVALAIKRAIKWAVDNGFDHVAFVNGQQSADRYGLEKHISKIRYEDANTGGVGPGANVSAPEGSGMLYAYDLDGNLVIDRHVDHARLEDYVGKEVAQRLLAQPGKSVRTSGGTDSRRRELSGLELKVGGEGMRTFYDKIVPKVAKEVLRKVGGGALTKLRIGTGGYFDGKPTTMAADQLAFDITPAMRDTLRSGVPLFEEREVYKVKQPLEQYDLPLDLFSLAQGEQQPLVGKRSDRRSAAAAAAKAAPQANTLAVRADPALPGIYHVTSQLVEIGRRDLPVATASNWQDAATALSALSDWAVEHMDVLITDKAGKPLAIVGGFKGAQTQTSIYPGTVLMEALRIEGAAHAWGVHNHPSGTTTLSRADEHLSKSMGQSFADSTVEWMGIAAVGKANGRLSFSAQDLDGTPHEGTITEGGATTSVPIVNRTLTVGNKGSTIDSPTQAKSVMAALAGDKAGILFLSAQNQVSAWVPLDHTRGARLTLGEGFDKLVNAAAEAGAGAAMVANPQLFGDEVVGNIKSALAKIDVRMLDAIDTTTGTSWAERGLMEPGKDYKVQRVQANEPLRSALASAVDRAYAVKLPAGYVVGDLMDRAGKISWWDKTVGTPFHLAKRYPAFKRVYDAVQNFLNDVSYYASEAANLAPRILPKLETWKDLMKSPLTAAQTKAIAAPIFEGTLAWTRVAGKPVKVGDLEAQAKDMTVHDKAHRLFKDGHLGEGEFKRWRNLPIASYEGAVENRYAERYLRAGIVWTDAELKSMFGLTEGDKGTIVLYREFRSAVDKSLTNLAVSDMLRLGGDDVSEEVRQKALALGDVDKAATLLRDHFYELAKAQAERAGVLNDTGDKMIEKGDRAQQLMSEGYAPLSRFGTYSLDIVSAEGERLYFGLFETPKERARMARQMVQNYPDAKVTLGTMSEEMFKNFAGVSPETLELFGDMLGLEAQGDDAASQAFQTWLKVVKANRSAMKRLIHRKGIAGFSEDAGRVLAGFVYSNARQTSSNLHMKEAKRAVIEIPKEQGELGTAATRLLGYVQNPVEEAHRIKAVLFAQYLGGSVAAALVNMTQPLAVTLPFLSQYVGAGRAAVLMRGAIADAMKATTGDVALDAALKKAEEEGIVSPQEVHQLLAQSMGRATLRSGDGTVAGDAYAKTANVLSKLALGWGKVFSLAEQANRRVTFIAAYRAALASGQANPAKFAENAVGETQFTYNKGNKPEWARGALGSVLMTFKQYSISYLELISRMWTQGGPEGKKAALLALAVLFLMGGADGLPFAQDADDVIDGALQHMGYNFSTKQARSEFFASVLGRDFGRFAEKGVSGLPGVPIDVSGRLGMGNLLPGTGLFTKKTDHTSDVAELAGPVGDLAKRAFQASSQLAEGEAKQAATTMAPKAAQNIAKAIDMSTMGMYRDDRGRKVLDTDGYEALVKALGFQPNSVSRVQEATRQVQQYIALNKMRETEIADKWAAGVFEGDAAKVAEARAELAEWNRVNSESPIVLNMAQIRRRVSQMRMSKADRMAKTAPREIRGEVKAELEAARQ